MDTQTKTTNAEEELKKFVDNLIAEKKFQVEPEIMEQLKEDLVGRAEDIINATIVAETPAEKLEELEQLLDSGNKNAVEIFCETNIPDLQNKIAQALGRFRKTYLGLE